MKKRYLFVVAAVLLGAALANGQYGPGGATAIPWSADQDANGKSITGLGDATTAAGASLNDLAASVVECRGDSRNAFFFTAGAWDVFRGEAGTTTVSTNQDAVITAVVTDPLFNDKVLFVNALRSREPEAVTITVPAGDGYTYDGTNTLTHTATSNVTATAIYSSASMAVTSSVSMAYSASGTVSNWTGAVSGTVREAIVSGIDTLLIAGKEMDLYADYDWTTETDTYVLNTNCWAYSLAQALTCVSPWAAGSRGTERSGTLISPVHFVNANHFPIANGTSIKWVGVDGTVVTRTVQSSMRVDASDIRIYRLNEAVPTNTISVAKFLPEDWEDYLPTDIFRMPMMGINKQEKVFVVDGSENQGTLTTILIPLGDRLSFHIQRVDGDSGNPAFLVIGGEPVLMLTWTTAAWGSSYTHYASLIEAAMATLGGGHTALEYVDLATYTEF